MNLEVSVTRFGRLDAETDSASVLSFPVARPEKAGSMLTALAEVAHTMDANESSFYLQEPTSLFQPKLRYRVVKEANVVQIQIIDTVEGKIVKEIPPDMVVQFIARQKLMREYDLEPAIDVVA
ncbi:MAG: flagellar protein FlaG [Synergistaceae bacterium]|jgi:hypothetical protein|nr:flagellar protein FlaG [Synergistaceae bacterium]